MATYYYDAGATGANNGGAGNDAWQDLQNAFSSISAGDTLYLKKHTSRVGSNGANLTVNIASSAGLQTQIIGYGSTPGDGVRFEISDGITVTTDFVFMANIDMLVTVSSPRAFKFQSDGGVLYNCVQDVAYTFGTGMEIVDSTAVKCWCRSIPGQTGNGAYRLNRGSLIDCYGELVGNGGGSPYGINCATGYRHSRIQGCTVIDKRTSAHNASVGIAVTGVGQAYFMEFNRNTVLDFGGDGFQFDGGIPTSANWSCAVTRNLVYNCGGYGFAKTTGSNSRNNGIALIGNAVGSCTQGAHDGNFYGYYDGVTLTNGVNPLTDYAPNTSSGGGALISGTYGFPDVTNPNNTTRKQWGSYGAHSAEPGGGGGGGGTVGFGI
jgi:hypothetical protein